MRAYNIDYMGKHSVVLDENIKKYEQVCNACF